MINWRTTALIFPGQGSQEVGMGSDLVAAFPYARAIFAQADEVLGFSLSDLCFNGPAETLNDTLNTQPALFIMGVALVRALSEA
ncbi:MAG: ACP S-malonyltransferase, partial [Chloroflexota bacterium]